MFVILRAFTYAILFAAVVLIVLPLRVLSWSGIRQPASIGWLQIAGIALCALGVLQAVRCVYVLARIGQGTPAPFDPPRRLVVRDPYEHVRNPLYIGGATVLAGAALYYRSLALLALVVAFLAAAHLLVVFYEEPALRRTFGEQYESYRRRVHRWVPGGTAPGYLRPHQERGPRAIHRD